MTFCYNYYEMSTNFKNVERHCLKQLDQEVNDWLPSWSAQSLGSRTWAPGHTLCPFPTYYSHTISQKA